MVCSRSVWPGSCSLSLLVELIIRLPSVWYAASNLGRMRMTSVGLSLRVKKTNFLVSLHTVPALFACDGWDDATTI